MVTRHRDETEGNEELKGFMYIRTYCILKGYIFDSKAYFHFIDIKVDRM